MGSNQLLLLQFYGNNFITSTCTGRLFRTSCSKGAGEVSVMYKLVLILNLVLVLGCSSLDLYEMCFPYGNTGWKPVDLSKLEKANFRKVAYDNELYPDNRNPEDKITNEEWFKKENDYFYCHEDKAWTLRKTENGYKSWVNVSIDLSH